MWMVVIVRWEVEVHMIVLLEQVEEGVLVLQCQHSKLRKPYCDAQFQAWVGEEVTRHLLWRSYFD